MRRPAGPIVRRFRVARLGATTGTTLAVVVTVLALVPAPPLLLDRGASARSTALGPETTLAVMAGAVPPATRASPTSSCFYVNLTQSGLSATTRWSFTIAGTSGSDTGSGRWSICLGAGVYPFEINPVLNFLPSPEQGNLTVSGNTPLRINFTAQLTRPVVFAAAGLPGGVGWAVNVNYTDGGGTVSHNGVGAYANFSLRNGSYTFRVAVPSGFGLYPTVYAFTVNNTNVTVPLRFHVGNLTVAFTESGLPNGTNWSVLFGSGRNSSSTDTIDCYVNGGSVPYLVPSAAGLVPTPSGGTVAVGPLGNAVSIVFALPTFPVVVDSSGLPAGSPWQVELNGSVEATNTTEVQFLEPNGSYALQVFAAPGYRVASYTVPVDVSGGAVLVNLRWNETRFPTEFLESGLASGTSWSVTINGTTLRGGSPGLATSLPNGTYRFEIGTVLGYSASPSGGSLWVFASNASQTVTFVAIPATAPFLSVSPLALYVLAAAGVAAAALGVAVFWNVRHGKR